MESLDIIEGIMAKSIELKASDIHITTNRDSSLRLHGKVIRVSGALVTDRALLEFCEKYSETPAEVYKQFERGEILSLDSAVAFHGRRFRSHLYKTINNICCVFRLLAEKVPDLNGLGLPESVKKFISPKSGLILVCGATGSGKTTTIASLIDQINKTKNDVIITIEDPIEYVYTEEKSVIEQREVGIHVNSFTQATVDALREDPDVIVVGEMRDLETIRNAITLAETGHLVFGTLHTKSAIDAIDRIVDIFPPAQQQQIRIQLASVIFGIVHQQLVPNGHGMAVLAEVVIVDPVFAGMIKNPGKSNTSSLRDYIRNKKDIGCVHIVDNILWHMENGRITSIEQVENNLSEEDLRMLRARIKK